MKEEMRNFWNQVAKDYEKKFGRKAMIEEACYREAIDFVVRYRKELVKDEFYEGVCKHLIKENTEDASEVACEKFWKSMYIDDIQIIQLRSLLRDPSAFSSYREVEQW